MRCPDLGFFVSSFGWIKHLFTIRKRIFPENFRKAFSLGFCVEKLIFRLVHIGTRVVCSLEIQRLRMADSDHVPFVSVIHYRKIVCQPLGIKFSVFKAFCVGSTVGITLRSIYFYVLAVYYGVWDLLVYHKKVISFRNKEAPIWVHRP